MTAQSLSAIAAIFPGDPNNAPTPINDTAGFRLALDGTVQTLSTNNSPDEGPIKGVLFVPSLQPHDPCNNLTAQFVPSNVTRHSDASQFGNDIIGLAPWISPACTQSFLNASQGAEPGALVLFHPSSDDTDQPPPLEDSSWRLDDSGDWKNENNYPVYAIPGPSGRTLMRELAAYSQNTSNSTDQLSASQSGEARLYAAIGIKGDGESPSIWGFILAILGSLLVLSVGVVVCYQFVQRRRRATIVRRRIASGEADLERLGISHMKVPREVLENLPIYPYPDLTPTPSSSAPSERDITQAELVQPPEQQDRPDQLPTELDSPAARGEEKVPTPDSSTFPKIPEPTASSKSDGNGDTTPVSTQSQTPPDRNAANRLSHSQTTCAICLDDFIPHTSTVRELPCGHIFHSTCIDIFLTQNSCLCPLCKKSVLPPGSYRVSVSRRAVRREMSMRSRGDSV